MFRWTGNWTTWNSILVDKQEKNYCTDWFNWPWLLREARVVVTKWGKYEYIWTTGLTEASLGDSVPSDSCKWTLRATIAWSKGKQPRVQSIRQVTYSSWNAIWRWEKLEWLTSEGVDEYQLWPWDQLQEWGLQFGLLILSESCLRYWKWLLLRRTGLASHHSS